MFKSLSAFLATLPKKIPIIRPDGAALNMVYFVLYIYALVIVLYITAWLFNWQRDGRAHLEGLIEIINCLSAPAVLASLQFFLSAVKDKDNDGVPDILQNAADYKQHQGGGQP